MSVKKTSGFWSQIRIRSLMIIQSVISVGLTAALGVVLPVSLTVTIPVMIVC